MASWKILCFVDVMAPQKAEGMQLLNANTMDGIGGPTEELLPNLRLRHDTSKYGHQTAPESQAECESTRMLWISFPKSWY